MEKVKWVQAEKWIQLQDDMAVYGTISENITDKRGLKYHWSARVVNEARIDYLPIQGYCDSLDGAKKIVEILCKETKTYLYLQGEFK